MNVVAEPEDAGRHVDTVRQVFGESVAVIAMQRRQSGGLCMSNSARSAARQVAVRNAERLEDRLGLFSRFDSTSQRNRRSLGFGDACANECVK